MTKLIDKQTGISIGLVIVLCAGVWCLAQISTDVEYLKTEVANIKDLLLSQGQIALQ